ncbi:MAG: hypothetical protein UV24_C0014G0016, partial [Candidatus Nomurabacteria bacterium GW2011_GWA2_42_41]
ESARKFKLRPQVLNQVVDAEYEKMWKEIQCGKKPVAQSTKSPYVLSSGQLNLAFA